MEWLVGLGIVAGVLYFNAEINSLKGKASDLKHEIHELREELSNVHREIDQLWNRE